MKDLNNIVVEVLTREHGKEVIKAFKELGVSTHGNTGICNKEGGHIDRYYGIVDGKFLFWNTTELSGTDAKIITLEQLKAMKEDKSEYPKIMWVSNTDFDQDYKGLKRTVIFYYNDLYWTIKPNERDVAIGWKYAQDIEEEKPEPEKKEKTLSVIIDGISVFVDGVEYVPKK